MTPASFALAAALVAWGAVPAPSPAPVSDVVETVPASPMAEPPPPLPAPAPVVVKQLFDESTPVPRRSSPPSLRLSRPARPERPDLFRNWRFWTISGGLFVATVVVTILVTRPGPQPYAGNLSPNVISLP